MTTHTTTLVSTNSSNADFQATCTHLHNRMLAAGYVQTADTGQINPATVVKPGTSNTAAGYLMYRAADTLQATAPLVVKWEVGAASTITRYAFWLTVGTASDGAGTLTGTVSSRLTVAQNGNPPVGTFECNTSYAADGSRIVGDLWEDTTATSLAVFFGIERLKDSAGADDGSGFALWLVLGLTSTSTIQFQTVKTPGGAGPVIGRFPAMWPGDLTDLVHNTDKGPLRVAGWKGVHTNPLLNLLIYAATNETRGNLVAPTVNGATHTFRACGDNFATMVHGVSASRPAMRWE